MLRTTLLQKYIRERPNSVVSKKAADLENLRSSKTVDVEPIEEVAIFWITTEQ
jgi:hypothetical protein